MTPHKLILTLTLICIALSGWAIATPVATAPNY